MAMLALVLSAFAAGTLITLDFVVIRRTERRLAREDEQAMNPRLDEKKRQDAKVDVENPTFQTVPKREGDVPAGLMAARVLCPVFGWLNFPATLAPVILVALTTQRFAWISDGQAAIIAIFVAALSMSMSLKAMRIGEFLDRRDIRYLPSLRQCIVYVLGWTVLVLALLLAAAPTTAVVSRLILTYVVLLAGFAAYLIRVNRYADRWLMT